VRTVFGNVTQSDTADICRRLRGLRWHHLQGDNSKPARSRWAGGERSSCFILDSHTPGLPLKWKLHRCWSFHCGINILYLKCTLFLRFALSYKSTNSVAFSLQANYTDWATATCQRNLVPTFVDRGVSRGQHGGSPTVVSLSFLDRNWYFLSSSSSFIIARAEWTPF
jgi:hypothetical protein